ncbi:flagellar basal body rod protein FlgC [Sandaracinobacteroides saxicola]|uniref:Flagellar basal-body rod protein FlgC n=1 Tax=Sandaracinobacteroides saxicola TaxID=2759707 RepID=A0A7G5IK06_9SPHN|nr:flagellar basal body rod protein FlgC [Sandaracinobacteroides saxicola]QMW23698.1 flagellar basal body rod protein FlgC [Sandaracinobacteroides saxicola]
MTNELATTLRVAESGLRAQSLRMRVVAENLANQHSLGTTPGADPYRRRMVTFGVTVDRNNGARLVNAGRIVADDTAFGRAFEPGNPAADSQGYVLRPNVNGLIESADMRLAQRGYEANISVIEAARSITSRTLELLK